MPPWSSENIFGPDPPQSLSSLSLAFVPFAAFFFSFFSFFSCFLRFRNAFSSGVSPSCLFRFFCCSPFAFGSSAVKASEVPLGAIGGAARTSSLAVFSATGCDIVPSAGAL